MGVGGKQSIVKDDEVCCADDMIKTALGVKKPPISNSLVTITN